MLANVTYQHTKVPQWTSMCIESCMKRLKDLNKPFKYIGELCARFPATRPQLTPRAPHLVGLNVAPYNGRRPLAPTRAQVPKCSAPARVRPQSPRC